MQKIIDWTMLIGCILGFIFLLIAWTSKTDRWAFHDCSITIPNEQGTFCQRFDYKGNIYYVRR